MSKTSTTPQTSPLLHHDRQPPTAIPPRTSSVAQHDSSHRRSKSASTHGLTSSKPLDFLKFARRSAHLPHKKSPLRHNRVSATMDETVTTSVQDLPHEELQTMDKERRKTIGHELIYQDKATWSESKDKIILGPYDYLYGHPGKDIRAQLIASFNKWLKVPEKSLKIITEVVGMLHTASLLVDDVEDSSLLRRGVPVAHSIFGTAQTINSANYVYFLALQELQKLNNPQAIAIYTEELINLHRGQGMDLYWRDSLKCPTEDDYLEMVSNKTGGLFRLAIKLMQAESSTNKNCTPLVNTISILFQVLDDYQNLSSAKYTATKGLAEDLTEGKFSFPVIHAIRADPTSHVIINILKQKTTDEEVKKYAIRYMESSGSFAYTRQVLRELHQKAHVLIEGLEEGEEDNKDKESGSGVRAILQLLRVETPVNSTPASERERGEQHRRVTTNSHSGTDTGSLTNGSSSNGGHSSNGILNGS